MMLKFRYIVSFLNAGFLLLVFFNNLSEQTELSGFRRTGDLIYASFSSVFHNKAYDQTEALLSRSNVENPIDCSFLCLAEPKCWSVNYGSLAGKSEEFLCELFSWSTFNESHLVTKDGFSHTRIKVSDSFYTCISRLEKNYYRYTKEIE